MTTPTPRPPAHLAVFVDAPTWSDDDGVQRPQGALAPCPTCGAPAGKLPFCPLDGSLLGSAFTVADYYQVTALREVDEQTFRFDTTHLLLGEAVDLVVLRPNHAGSDDAASRVLRDARTVAQLEHEHIATLLDAGHDDRLGFTYLVTEQVAGESLDQWSRDRGPLSWKRVVKLTRQLCSALGATHNRKIAHNQLALRSALISSPGELGDRLLVRGFGLHQLTVRPMPTVAAGTGTLLGCAADLLKPPPSPSPAPGFDPQPDIRAIGTIAYQLLTGHAPPEAPTTNAVLASLSDSDAPAALQQLLAGCLEQGSQAAFESVAHVELALNHVSRPPLPGGDRERPEAICVAGGYQLIEPLGTGRLSTVYRANHEVIGSKAAVKVLHAHVATNDELVTRFVNEARATNDITSPHIPRYVDFGHLEDGRPYAVMELLEGETLAQRLARTGPLPVPMVAELVRQCATALASAHEVEVVHRDIKPKNLFLAVDATGRETVKLLDFGMSKMLTAGGSAAMTRAGFFLGTPHYCAPEQIRGELVGPSADIYALGATAFEALTGRPPFVGEVNEVLGAKLTRKPPTVRELRIDTPRRATDTIAAMLAIEPAARPQSMHQVLALTERWLDPEPPITEQVAMSLAESEARARHRWLVRDLLPVLLAIGAAIALLWVLTERDHRRRHQPTAPEASVAQPVPTAEQTAPTPSTAQSPETAPTPIVAPAAATTEKPSPTPAARAPKRRSKRHRKPAGRSQRSKSTPPPAATDDVVIVNPFGVKP